MLTIITTVVGADSYQSFPSCQFRPGRTCSLSPLRSHHAPGERPTTTVKTPPSPTGNPSENTIPTSSRRHRGQENSSLSYSPTSAGITNTRCSGGVYVLRGQGWNRPVVGWKREEDAQTELLGLPQVLKGVRGHHVHDSLLPQRWRK